MENCIVTELIGAAENENLRYFDTFPVFVDSSFPLRSNSIIIKGSGKMIIEATDGGSFKINNDDTVRYSYETTENQLLTLKFTNSSSYKLLIKNKRYLRQIIFTQDANYCYKIDLSYLNDVPLVYLGGMGIGTNSYGDLTIEDAIHLTFFQLLGTNTVSTIDFNTLQDNTVLERVDMQVKKIAGSISTLAGKPSLTDINIRYSTGITGNIESLYTDTALTTLNVQGCSSISGEITTLITNMASNRDSGTLKIIANSTSVKYNGSTLSELGKSYVSYDFATGQYITG